MCLQLEVREFVREHGLDLRRTSATAAACRRTRCAFRLPKPGEIGIAVRGALRPVHDVDVACAGSRSVRAARRCVGAALRPASGENLLKSPAIQRGQAQSSTSENAIQTSPADEPPVLAGAGHDPEHVATTAPPSRPPRSSDLQQVRQERARRGAVEAEALLEHEGPAQTKRAARRRPARARPAGRAPCPARTGGSPKLAASRPQPGDAAAQGQRDAARPHRTATSRRPKPLPCRGVIGRLAMLVQADDLAQRRRAPSSRWASDVSHLAPRQPELHRQVRGKRREEAAVNQ